MDQNLPNIFEPSLFASTSYPAPIPSSLQKWFTIFDNAIVGQIKAKQALALALALHEQKIRLSSDIRIPALLLIGPTGSGKSLLSEVVRENSEFPFTYCAVPTLTNANYKGVSLLSHLRSLTQTSSTGIMWIDELDKLLAKQNQVSDGFHNAMQHELIDMLGSRSISLQGHNDLSQEIDRTTDPSNVLFVFSGAFVELLDIISKRLGITKKRSMGFGRSLDVLQDSQNTIDLYAQATHDDLIEMGLLPELAGRIGDIAALSVPAEKDYIVFINKNLAEERVKQYSNLIGYEGRSITLSEEAIREIAALAVRKSLGYRGIDQIIHMLMRQAIYSTKWNIVLGKEDVRQILEM